MKLNDDRCAVQCFEKIKYKTKKQKLTINFTANVRNVLNHFERFRTLNSTTVIVFLLHPIDNDLGSCIIFGLFGQSCTNNQFLRLKIEYQFWA